jgi:hypothetical protein
MRMIEVFSQPTGVRLARHTSAAVLERTAKAPLKNEPKEEPEPARTPSDMVPSTAFWRGASGRLYRHSAHTTIFCPAPQQGIYLLAKRDADGNPVPLFAGVAASAAATLNLAHIRRRAVTIGATEVHLCPVHSAGSVFGLRRIAHDLRRNFAAR